MNLRQTILAEHSKAQRNKIVDWIGNDQKKFDELFYLFINDEYRVVQRAAWPLSCCVILHPELISKHFKLLITYSSKTYLPVAVKRNTLRLLQQIEIPIKYQGEVMNSCFSYISDPAEAAANKAYALSILQNLSKLYPDIIEEIKLIIENRFNQESPAFQSRAKKFLNSLPL